MDEPLRRATGVRASGSDSALMQNLIDSLVSELVVLDAEGNIVLMNHAWKGFARENGADRSQNFGIGRNYLEVCSSASGVASEGAREVHAGLEEVLSGARENFFFEYPCHSPTHPRWFLLEATRLGGPAGGAVLLHVEITARKLLERRLQEQEARFRLALEHSPVVVFCQDCDLRYTWINSPVLAWAEKNYLGRTDQEIVGGPEGQELIAIKRAVLESGVGSRSEVVVPFNGEKHYYDMTAEPMRDSAGSIRGITCCATDITHLKRAAAERDRLIAELEEAHRDLVRRNVELELLHIEKTRWLGMANHDLRNPLNAILARCELMFDDADVSVEEYRDTLKTIYSSSQFMSEILNDVLDISAIDSGKQRLRLEPTNLRSLIEESVAISRPLADQKGTHIEGQYQDGTPVVTVDNRQMLQVFQNLIVNAIKYSPDGARIELAVTADEGNVLVTIRDNGPGVPDDELHSIFTPFYRSRVPGLQHGTGLGLAICKRIVEGHGGKIWAENAVGGGAVFRISLTADVPSERNVLTTGAG